jgi:hypothetical protein
MPTALEIKYVLVVSNLKFVVTNNFAKPVKD